MPHSIHAAVAPSLLPDSTADAAVAPSLLPDSIADAAVALSLMLEALRLLDEPEHAEAAAYLLRAIDKLSPEWQQDPSPFDGMEIPGEPWGVALR